MFKSCNSIIINYQKLMVIQIQHEISLKEFFGIKSGLLFI
jgi:hypothetical protein